MCPPKAVLECGAGRSRSNERNTSQNRSKNSRPNVFAFSGWTHTPEVSGTSENIETHTAWGESTSVAPQASCESMCVFLLLSGKVRYVPEKAHVRVHQIWMGDRAEDAKASTYTAQDMMIIERDIGRLAKYTFDMGGTGDLLSLALNAPPWEDLHELSPQELQMTGLATTDTVADVLSESRGTDPAIASLTPKSIQDRFVRSAADEKISLASKPAKTAEAALPTGGDAAVAPALK